MYKLKLTAKECISCGICMDVCLPKAIDMRVHRGNNIEGNTLFYLALNGNSNQVQVSEQMMTFPFMVNAKLCDGCMECAEECPTNAIKILFNSGHG
ncbi:MAG: 4Fe-4S binding protein [Ignavibacteria bacterium]|nr:4Fe-4S binding protein [Ignavibacteria bacterium]